MNPFKIHIRQCWRIYRQTLKGEIPANNDTLFFLSVIDSLKIKYFFFGCLFIFFSSSIFIFIKTRLFSFVVVFVDFCWKYSQTNDLGVNVASSIYLFTLFIYLLFFVEVGEKLNDEFFLSLHPFNLICMHLIFFSLWNPTVRWGRGNINAKRRRKRKKRKRRKKKSKNKTWKI